ncbi:MAG: 16S rRNA (adenine(1518)-N(6)/adenine(1519)-N(6))-dimethyltransferase RsmA [Blastocatellales bacterium]|nr:16S rRNA (adenine(1518)-N(6)/adenine(1519)-N(6))-dimethyltransferase RsmA [Blastocatellales bacterium]
MRAKRRFGQNFLAEPRYRQRIIQAVNPQPGETIIEIGPGRGALTRPLAESGARIIAIEIDRELVPDLAAGFAGFSNVRIIEADALEVDYCKLIEPALTARIVANLPYYISTPILQKLISSRRCLTEMTLMLQREVVDRLTAAPGGKQYGYLSVIAQLNCEIARLFDVPPGAFRPVPKVDSSVVRVRVLDEPRARVSDETMFTELAQVIFAQRRKTLLNNLRAGGARLSLSGVFEMEAALARARIDPARRAETLAVSDIAALAEALVNKNREIEE